MRVFILACLVAAATALAPLHVAKERIPGKYIVTLKVSQSYRWYFNLKYQKQSLEALYAFKITEPMYIKMVSCSY